LDGKVAARRIALLQSCETSGGSHMKLLKLFGVVLGLFCVQPAHAATIFQISGIADGVIRGVVPCEMMGWCPEEEEPFSHVFNFLITAEPNDQGVYNFTHGPSTNAGIHQVSFRSLGEGLFEPINLTYYQGHCHIIPGSGCERTASTQQFSITAIMPGAVPEPATWAMMISGLVAIGWGLRRRRIAHAIIA